MIYLWVLAGLFLVVTFIVSVAQYKEAKNSNKLFFQISLFEVAIIFFIITTFVSFLTPAVNTAKHKLNPEIEPGTPSAEYKRGLFSPSLDPARYSIEHRYPAFILLNPTHGWPLWIKLSYPFLFGITVAFVVIMCLVIIRSMLPERFSRRIIWRKPKDE